jgi:hypothetical protein
MQINSITGASKSFTGDIFTAVNKWYHIAFVYSGTTGTIYVNGTMSDTRTGFTSSSLINASRLYNYFGGSYSNNYIGDVQLDEIKLYNKGLTQAQVQLDMNTVGISPVC